MKSSRLLQLLTVSTSLLTGACLSSPDASDDSAASDEGTVVHMIPMQSADKVASVAPAGAHLTYFGGPLLTHVHVVPVYWNSGTQFQSNLNSFYSVITGSALYTQLSQYSIGLGNAQAGFVDNRATASINDSAIHTELNRLFTAGSLPAPNASNYYPVHFPAGMNITAPDGSRSCVVFCAYHGTYVRNGVNVNYGVIPDQGGGCAGGCGANPSRVNNLTSVASHELVEATTDPAVGLATVFGPPLSWYDPNNGEIGDICNAQQKTVSGFVVQKEFSNAANDCI